MDNPRHLIVSNRLPVTMRSVAGRVTLERSTGGLATALSHVHGPQGSLWAGWPGDTSGLGPADRRQLDAQLRDNGLEPVHLGPRQMERYYEGFANGVLWPLFHYSLDRVRLDAWRDWEAYREANERFADAVARAYRPGDQIWVQDYQLALVPALLRERLPTAAIGFFLHIPFPSSSVFRILPWRRPILEGLLGADLVGFHTLAYQRHFASCVLRLLGVDVHMDEILYQDRLVRIGAFPIAIDTGHFSAGAQLPAVVSAAAAVRQQTDGCQLLLGVDRLDYTKGLRRRMLAIERLLERAPHLVGKVKFIQVAVPSRTGVDSYAALRRQLDELVGRVNGRFSTVSWSPVQYLYRSLDEDELLALYRAADVMLVTPLRDGMNLVAKEFIACRDEDDGVLVLSEFAGATWELGEALVVNPFDVDQTAAAIQEALEMPGEERARRMRMLRARVRTWTVHDWTAAFDRTLHEVAAENLRRQQATALGEDDVERLLSAPCLLLVLDYDGTLVPLAPSPDLARPDAELIELLRRLAARPDRLVHLASGRDRATLELWFGELELGLHAEHGFWGRPRREAAWVARGQLAAPWRGRVRAIMEELTARTPGSLVEEKTASICWHYRQCEPRLAARQERELRLHLGDLLRNQQAEVLTGNKVVEVRQQGIHKGLIVPSLLDGAPLGTLVVAMGDDTTDEDTFTTLPAGGVSIHVGPQRSAAQFRLPDHHAARGLLARLAG